MVSVSVCGVVLLFYRGRTGGRGCEALYGQCLVFKTGGNNVFSPAQYGTGVRDVSYPLSVGTDPLYPAGGSYVCEFRHYDCIQKGVLV